MNNIIDEIEEKIREFLEDSSDEPAILEVDTYTYAMIMEEIGWDTNKVFNKYKGLKIRVNEDATELIKII